MSKFRFFSNQKMPWLKVIILAVASAVITAVLKIIPALEGTSFQDIAVNPDCWFLFALFIIVNCDKWWEASLKTFVFFLISQPLIYLIQVPFSSMGFELFKYYKYWFVITILTLPGAAVAFLVKKKNWLSAAVLSVAVGYLGYAAATYFWNVKSDFPHHLVSLIFCVLLAIFFVLALLDKNSQRLAVMAVMVVVIAGTLYFTKPISTKDISLDKGSWTYVVDDSNIADISITDGNDVSFKAKKKGNAIVTFTNENGEIIEYWVTVSNGSILVGSLS